MFPLGLMLRSAIRCTSRELHSLIVLPYRLCQGQYVERYSPLQAMLPKKNTSVIQHKTSKMAQYFSVRFMRNRTEKPHCMPASKIRGIWRYRQGPYTTGTVLQLCTTQRLYGAIIWFMGPYTCAAQFLPQNKQNLFKVLKAVQSICHLHWSFTAKTIQHRL